MNQHERRFLRILTIRAVLLAAPAIPCVAAAGQARQPVPRVRSESVTLRRLITQATEESATFRREIEAIDASDGLVYVQDGRCGRGLAACFMHSVELAGPYRLLRVKVDLRRSALETMAAVGHELRHALEILSDPRLRTNEAIYFFYRRVPSASNYAFETDVAEQAERDIRAELRASDTQR